MSLLRHPQKLPVTIDGITADFNMLKCPCCGGEYLHHCHVVVFERDEDGIETLVTHIGRTSVLSQIERSDDCDNPSSRRHGVKIGFWCETCGDGGKSDPAIATLFLSIAQHKGVTNIQWETVP